MSGGPRYVWRIAFQNFINSFRPRQVSGNDIGKDYIGNKYYEIPADPSVGRRNSKRWYFPPKGRDFMDPIPAEWQAWLRKTREHPPTEDEISKNLAVAELKKVNASKIEEKRLLHGGSTPAVPTKGKQSFPAYPDLPSGDPERFLYDKKDDFNK